MKFMVKQSAAQTKCSVRRSGVLFYSEKNSTNENTYIGITVEKHCDRQTEKGYRRSIG